MEEIKAILADDEKLTQVTKAVFDSVDTDASGHIDKGELKASMQQIAAQGDFPAPTDEQVEETLKSLDVNQDGEISPDEFKVLVRQILETLAVAN